MVFEQLYKTLAHHSGGAENSDSNFLGHQAQIAFRPVSSRSE
jgi:hypothetical protein